MFETRVSVLAGILLATAADAEVLSDPMRPYTFQVQTERRLAGKTFVLSAILFSIDRRVAVVNGQPVSEGQRVQGAKVRRIRRGEVELQVDGEILKLTLGNDKQAK